MYKLLDVLTCAHCFYQEPKDPQLVKFLKADVPVIWVMGPPYSGKTTTANKLAEITKYSVVKISQLIKQAASKGGYQAMVINDLIASSGAVTDDIAVKMLLQNILPRFEQSVGFIIDGFPIDIREAKTFTKFFCKPKGIIYLNVLKKDLLLRIPRRSEIDKEVNIQNQWLIKLNLVYKAFQKDTIKVVTNKSVETVCEVIIEFLNRRKFNFPTRDAEM